MKTPRIFLAGALLCALVSNAHAFDTAGKFGMGFRFLGTPVVAFTNMKIGLVNAFGLEPSAGYYTWKDEYKGPYYSSESTNSMLIFSLMGDINAIKAKRSNLVLKLGAAYASTRSHYSSDGTESTTSGRTLQCWEESASSTSSTAPSQYTRVRCPATGVQQKKIRIGRASYLSCPSTPSFWTSRWSGIWSRTT